MIIDHSFLGLFLWLLLLPALFTLGRVCLGASEDEDPFVWGATGIALGLFLLAHLSALLGLFQQFNSWTVGGVVAVLFIIFAVNPQPFKQWIVLGGQLFAGGRSLERALGGLLALGFLAAVALCLLPEIANDALCYQLNVAKNFALRHSMIPDPYDFNSYTSTMMNSLYAVGLLFKSISAAKLFHALCGFLLIAVLVRRIELQTRSLIIARLTGLLLFLTPTLSYEVTTTYVDLAVSFFILLSFDRFLAAEKSGKGRDWMLCGLLLGAAVSSKILILMAGVPYGILFLRRLLQTSKKYTVFGEAALFAAGVLLASGYLFVQSYVLTGNPVFPYFGNFFGTVEFGMLGQFLAMGPAKSIHGFFLLPWNVTFHPGDYDGGYPLGPFFLMLLPFAVAAAVKSPAHRPHLLFVAGFFPPWYLLFHNVRFLFPALCLYVWAAVAGGVVLLQQRRPRVQKMILTCFILLLLPLGGIFGYHYRSQWPVIMGMKSTEAYLREMERSYPLALWMDQNLPKDALILNAEEIRQFYFPRQSVREIWFYLRTRYDRLTTPQAVSQELKNRGFTHVLMYRLNHDGFSEEDSRYKLLRQLTQNGALSESVGVIASENTREKAFTYEVFRLR